MTDEYSKELDLVFALLSTVEFPTGYNDNSGLRVGELNYTKEFTIADIDGGLIDPHEAMKEEFADKIAADYEALMATGVKEWTFTPNGVEYKVPDTEFKIRGAYMYRRVLPLRDTYEFWLNLTV